MKRDSQKLRIILTGGGTGGHVYPTLAIFEILRESFQVEDVLYLGCRGKAEEKIVPRRGIPIRFISSSPISGISRKDFLKAFFKIFKGVFESLFIMIKFKPDVVLAGGGYVSAPVIIASFILKPFLKCKIILDEQNTYPGLLNRFGSLFADLVFISFKESVRFLWSNRCVYSGYPVRKEFLEEFDISKVRRKLNLPEDKFIVLVSGGSMGARNINRVVANSLQKFKDVKDILIIHSCGLSEVPYNGFMDTFSILKKRGFEIELREDGNLKEGIIKNRRGDVFYIFKNFIYDMSDYMKSADLIVSRAGAGSITEICALKKPSLLIPKRDLPGFHQELNGISLAEKGGCEILFEKKDNSGNTFVDEDEFANILLKLLNNRNSLKRMGKIAGKNFVRNFREIFLNTISSLMEGREINFLNPITISSGMTLQGEIEKAIFLLRKVDGSSPYAKFFNNKVDEYLSSDDWMTFNNGVKLAGALKREDKLKLLVEKFASGNGFIRRNILITLGEIGRFEEYIVNLIDDALKDKYYEVRREGVKLLRRFYSEIEDGRKYYKLLISMLEKYREHFEVKCEILKTLPHLVSEEDYYSLVEKYIVKENVIFREAILDGILNGFKSEIFKDREKVYNLVNKMLITTSYFKPHFGIRDKYYELYKYLESVKND